VLSTSDPDRLEGYNPSMTIIDEVHGFDPEKIPEVYNAIIQGTGERANPLTILASTAGKNENVWFIDKINYYKSVLDKKVDDPNVAGMIYQPDEGDDLSKRATWAKANPSMDLIFDGYKLDQEYYKAKNTASQDDMWYFLTKRANIFYDEPNNWLKPDQLHKCFKPLDITTFKGRPCILSLDLSHSKDLTALSVIFEDKDIQKHFYLFTYYFMANEPGNIIRKNGFDLTKYIEDGTIQVSDSNLVDGQQVMEKIREIKQYFGVEKLLYDPFGAPYFIADIQAEMNIYVEPFKQSAMNFNVPINFIEDKVAVEGITFATNPVLEWNFSNVVITQRDSNMNKKMDKSKKREAIDGAISTAMCIGGWLDYHYPILKN